MSSLVCPKCSTPIEPADVNVAADVMFCRPCSQVFSLSSTVATGGVFDALRRPTTPRPPIDLDRPPKGAWFSDMGNEFRFGGSTRSAMAFFLVPFMIVWSGGSLGGIYGSQIANGEFNLLMSLFGIPFLLGSILFWSLALMSIWGKVEITIRDDDGTIFTGIGSIGRRKHFRCSEMTLVREDIVTGKDSRSHVIVMEGATRIKFGSMLNEERRYFVMEVLKTMIGK